MTYTRRRLPRLSPAKKRDNPEHRFQISVATYLRYALPADWRFTASAAGVALPPKLAAQLKAAGQEPGWSDLQLRQKGTGETRWLELKAPKGVLSEAQRDFRDDCPQNYAMARTLEDVEAALIGWSITPRCTIGHANRYHTDGKKSAA